MKNQNLQKPLYLITGKWKLLIINSLLVDKKRFKDFKSELKGVTARQLSKELKELEIDKLVKRIVYDSIPITIEYEITKKGKSLEKVIKEIINWGENK